jgi:hypothetical protein
MLYLCVDRPLLAWSTGRGDSRVPEYPQQVLHSSVTLHSKCYSTPSPTPLASEGGESHVRGPRPTPLPFASEGGESYVTVIPPLLVKAVRAMLQDTPSLQ